jgi:hypothetical protein
MPSSGVGFVWFEDLIQCLEFMGIPCAVIQRNDKDFYVKWASFQPNVFISMDLPEVLRSLDLNFINGYKKSHGCLRFLTPIVTHRFPAPGMSRDDQWRLALAIAGKSVDAYFSMMVPEFFSQFFANWENAGFRYLWLPNACNPFRHFPECGKKEFDYFMVTSYGTDRVRVTRKYLKSIFENYYGLWAGEGWGFGEGYIEPNKLRLYYARTRIALNPLQNYLIRFPSETTERSFSAIACGAFQITNRTPVTNLFFSSDELCCVDNDVDFLDCFEYYVNRPDERNEITLRGIRRVFLEHTYFHRITNLVHFLDNSRHLF